MKMTKIFWSLCAVLFFLLLTEILCIANHKHNDNLITSEERRGAADDYKKSKGDNAKAETKKRGLYASLGTHHKHQSYPSGYGSIGGTGYDGSGSGYPYIPPSGNHHHFSGYGQGFPSGHGTSFGHSSGHEGNYGHSGPGHDVYDHGVQNHGHSSHALALKGLLIPLAGIALLGAAAALSTNPVLLQLGVVNGRRRRSMSYDIYPVNPKVKPNRR